MSWAEVKKINSDMAMPLDKLITDKTNIKIQMVTFTFTTSSSTDNQTKTIDAVDTSKSIIIPVSYVNVSSVSSLSFGFSTNAVVFCNRTVSVGRDPFDYTLAVITFGATVN